MAGTRHTPESAPPPVTAWQAFKSMCRKTRSFLFELAIPVGSWRNFGAFLISSQIALPLGLTVLAPSGEDLLRRDGLDPAIAQQLGAQRTRILPTTFTGMTLQHSIGTFPGIAAGYALFKMIAPPESRPAAHKGLSYTPHWLAGMCTITLPDLEGYDINNIIGIDATIQRRSRGERPTPFPVSAREAFWTVAFHEMRHCAQSPGFWADGLIYESEADLKAVTKAAEIFNNPEIPYFWLHSRAMNVDGGDHDTALYLDAALNNQPLPTQAEMYAAAEEIGDQLAAFHKKNFGEDPGFLTLSQKFAVPALQDVVLIESVAEKMSPLAKRRVLLYLQAVEYMTGTTIEGVAEAAASGKFAHPSKLIEPAP